MQLFFVMTLSKKDIFILENIKNYLGVGRINKIESRSAITYMVTSVTDIELLIKFFDNYPLITDKLGDSALFKQAFNLMQQDLHLTMKGLL